MPCVAPLSHVLALALLQSAQPPAPAQDALPAADPAVTRAELEHHVRVLAADDLGGRAPLTAGAERNASYLARALAAAGVEPAGEDGSYFQVTGLKRQEYPSVPRLLFTDESGKEVEARYGVDFTLDPRGMARSTAKLPLRFFYDYNHARMPLVGNPAEAIYFSATKQDKDRILAKKGIASLADWGLEFTLLPGELGLGPGRPRDSIPARVAGQADGCEQVKLRGPMRTSFERRKFTHVQLLVEEVVLPFDDKNVVGRIRGVGTPERPELADEVVVLVANYDRVLQHNGANGNASGCAALLELAQAFGAGTKPARTLVFLFTTSEEGSSKAGSQRYCESPAEPLAKTVLFLSLDRLGRPDGELGAGHLWLTDFERSNLGPFWRERALPIGPDPRPEEPFSRRLAVRRFVTRGLLAQALSSLAPEHEPASPHDHPDGLDYAHLETVARVSLEAARTLADGSVQPKRIGRAKDDDREGQEALRARMRDRLRNPGGDAGDDSRDGDEAEDGRR